jgi:Family of unknown function (DUF6483)
MITRDYLMEEAERLTKLIAAVVFQRHLEEEQSGVEYSISQDAMLLGDLRRMTLAGNINEAENLLFERLLVDPTGHNFSVAGIFYRELSQLTDDELESASFSREEIMEGLQSIERIAEAYKDR